MRVIALFGPTGVGKTAVAIALAEILRGEGENPLAISADALQVYRGLELLTGAADAAQQERLEHRLLSFVSPQDTFSAGQFAARARDEIDGALSAGRRPLLVGGTGLYLQAALTDLELRPPPDPEVRARLEARADEGGVGALYVELARRSAHAAERIDPRDRSRVIRALELLEMGEQPPPAGADSRLWTARLRRPAILFGLVMERASLYRRIDARVDEMVAAGAAEQVRAAANAGASRTARAAVGFDELLRGDVEAMKRHSRNYARRQLTWMRRLTGVHAIDMTDLAPSAAAERIAHILAARPGEAQDRGEST
jgi:tRNA dimethylallyltransferase